MRRPDPVREQAPRYVASRIAIRHASASPPAAPRTRGSTASQLKRKRPNDSQHKTLNESIWRAAREYCARHFDEWTGGRARGLGLRFQAALAGK